jgi:uncharacterized repeat protein (TIGR03803 family)
MRNGHLSIFALLISVHVGAAQNAPEQYSVLYSFKGGAGDGAYPVSSLVIGKDGRLFGTTQWGGSGACQGVGAYSGCGTVFQLSPPTPSGRAWTETVLYSFTGQNGDGMGPVAGLVTDGSGALYGTTLMGGTANNGTAFVLTPPSRDAPSDTAWTETVLHDFTGGDSDGAQPYAGLVIGLNGALYGTTWKGGSHNLGTIFQLVPPAAPGGSWTERILHNFSGPDGFEPVGALVFGKNGWLYGVTSSTGSDVAFVLNPPSPGKPSREKVLCNFGLLYTVPQGANSGLAVGQDGTIYGTSFLGGFPGTLCNSLLPSCGTVFEVSPPGPGSPAGTAWAETIIDYFDDPLGSANPNGGVVIGSGGALFGTTTTAICCGTVFKLTPPATAGAAWTETLLHNFSQSGDGSLPEAALVITPNGALYGTTSQGGADGMGTVFELIP